MKGKALIVGAGASGLTSGYMLASQGWDVTIAEKENLVGGLARSFNYNGYSFDCGPHILHTDDKEVEEFILHVLGDQKLDIKLNNSVYFFGKYHDWPLKRDTIFKLPFKVMIGSLVDLFTKKPPKDETFQEHILSLYGKTLFDHFFKDYTEKFLMHTCDKLHADSASAGINRAVVVKSIKANTLTQIIKSTLLPKPTDARVYYPTNGGIGTMYEHLAEMVKSKGGEILLNSQVTDVFKSCDKITKVTISDITGNQSTYSPDIVIWTAPPQILACMMDLPRWDLKYLDSVFYNFEVYGKPAMPRHWIYYGSREFSLNRVSFPGNFGARTVPEGKHGLCCELSSLDHDDLWMNPESVKNKVIDDVLSASLIKNREDIIATHIEKMPNTYPIYTIDYRKKLTEAFSRFHQYKNIMFTGRTGSFCYINMHHCMRMVFNMIAALNKNGDPQEWQRQMMQDRTLDPLA